MRTRAARPYVRRMLSRGLRSSLSRTALLGPVVFLALAAPAVAGSVVSNEYVSFIGTGAENNDVLVEFQPGPGDLQEAVFTDRSGAPIQCWTIDGARPCPATTWGLAGCRQGAHPGEAICAQRPEVRFFRFFLGDGDDAVELEPTAGHPVVARGENGNDVLTGTDGADWLDGGGDDDVLRGGDGDDTAPWRLAPRPTRRRIRRRRSERWCRRGRLELCGTPDRRAGQPGRRGR